MKTCFGYIRVSTQKQGEGVSLQHQRDAIETFAARTGVRIIDWFEEKETAAKSGRPVFNRMLSQLKRGRADGLIIHKIDRSARNLRDWSAIGELADAGVDVYFATETLDFRSRGGRLTADIQAVIAADYIRNLRDETIKGLQGRLKQGLYPFRAPVGYLDQGRGKPKVPCPKTAPLIRELFDRYATGQYTYLTLIDLISSRGLRNNRGGLITLHGIETILGNPFYAGLIHIARTGQTFQGIHEPLIPMSLFKRVEAIRKGRRGQITTRHRHLFRRLFTCGLCGGCMVPELQKGRCYYRCKKRDCPTKTVREDVIEAELRASLRSLIASARVEAEIEDRKKTETINTDIDAARNAVEREIGELEARQVRLEDLVIDGTIDRSHFKERRREIEARLTELRQDLTRLPTQEDLTRLTEDLAELRKSLCSAYELADKDEKRILVESVWPNRKVVQRSVVLEPSEWLREALCGKPIPIGDPQWGHGRTFETVMKVLKKAVDASGQLGEGHGEAA